MLSVWFTLDNQACKCAVTNGIIFLVAGLTV